MIRTTLVSYSDTVSVSIPKEYIGKEIEIIAFATSETSAIKQYEKKQVSFDAISLNTAGFTFNREEANER